MTRRRTPQSSQSFSPYILATWQKAVKENGLRIKVGSKVTAQATRFQLYSIRRSLKMEGDDLYPLIVGFKISLIVSAGSGDYYLELATGGNTEVDKALQEAGIEVEEAPDPEDFIHTKEVEERTALEELEEEEYNPYVEGPKKGAKV